MSKTIVRTPGGRALSTAWGTLDIPWHDSFQQDAFCIEVWAQPGVPREYLVSCVYPDGTPGDFAGWTLEIGCQGELAARLIYRTAKTRIVWNQARILDGKFHHLAMSWDGRDLILTVDGQQTRQEEQLTELTALGHAPGLRVGAEASVVCESLVHEVRLSRETRLHRPEDSDVEDRTIGLWRIDESTRNQAPDISGRCPTGIIKPFKSESLDAQERRDYSAGPTPLDIPAESIRLHAGRTFHGEAAPVLCLDGEWELTEGRDDSSHPWSASIPATVPGSVHAALYRAGKIPDPTFGLNESIAREQSFKTWYYRTTFPRPAGRRHRLIFDGVAIHSTVWLNDAKLGSHEGMFGGPEFDISTLLREQNTLVVRLDPAPTGPPWFAPTANTGWKKTVVFNNVYGWHYCNIPSLGIWRSVRIESAPTIKLHNPFVVTHNIDTGEISLRLDASGPREGWNGQLTGTISPENFKGESRHFSIAVESEFPDKSLHFRMRIPDARAWWPNGLGEANLYRLTLSIQPHDGATGDRVSTTFGLRTLQMAPLPGGERPNLYNWTFVINGRPTFLKGTGWCTMDALMDFSRGRYEHFLRRAKEQNCQLIRAWGSGMPETDDFYDLCDRLGLCVMQEWPTAWNSHDEQPYDALEETVRRNTLRMRNHPSLLMYGGGNESSRPSGKAINMMGKLSIELDDTRPFHRGEPWGGSDHNYACWWGNVHLDNNLKLTSRFFGEFGIASMPVYESVQRYLPEDEKSLWPPYEDGTLAHHTPVFNTMKDMDRLRQYAGYFSNGATMRRFIVASQIAQAVAVRHTLERARTRWPKCTGALMYKLNDNYPGASWSTVDWYGALKIGHWFVQDAFAPLHACLLFDSVNTNGKSLEIPVYLLDDADALSKSRWRVDVHAYNGQLRLIKSEQFEGAGSIDRAAEIARFNLSARQTDTTPLFLMAEVFRDNKSEGRTFYFLNYEAAKDSLFALPTTTLALDIANGLVNVLNTGRVCAVGASVQRPGHLDTFNASDNCFWLAPGESRRLVVSNTDGLCVDAWNLEGKSW